MNILVTGGLGFIGHNVVAQLEKFDHQIVVVDNMTDYGMIPSKELQYILSERSSKIKSSSIECIDICDKKIEKLFNKYSFDQIIHLASFPRQRIVNADPLLGSRVMIEGLLNLLELSVKYKVKKFTYISSSMVYGDFTDHTAEDAQCRPLGQYAIMKLAGENLVRDYTRKTKDDLKHLIIRPSAVYGPLDVEDRVISKFMLNAIRNKPVSVNGQNDMLDFTYVDDVVDGIVKATNSCNSDNKTYNITRGKSRSLLEAAQCAVDLVQSGSITILPRDETYPVRGTLCNDAAKKDFHYEPRFDLEQGLMQYYEWIKNSDYLCQVK